MMRKIKCPKCGKLMVEPKYRVAVRGTLILECSNCGWKMEIDAGDKIVKKGDHYEVVKVNYLGGVFDGNK